jgi:hypothetical protein
MIPVRDHEIPGRAWPEAISHGAVATSVPQRRQRGGKATGSVCREPQHPARRATAALTRRAVIRWATRAYRLRGSPWHCLNLRPEPHGHGAFRPTLE